MKYETITIIIAITVTVGVTITLSNITIRAIANMIKKLFLLNLQNVNRYLREKLNLKLKPKQFLNKLWLEKSFYFDKENLLNAFSNEMLTFDGAVTLWRFLLTVGPSATVILLLLNGIKEFRPDIVDLENRVESIHVDDLRDSYDFIVVGGGSAGCVLASRLSEVQQWSVLLLEAGGDEPLLADLPVLFPAFQRSPWDWKYRTEPSEHFCLAMQNQRCLWPRGKMLGGCSSINAMLYIRGNRRDYDHWAEIGNLGWNYDNVLHYFLKMEDFRVKGLELNPYHSQKGLLTVEEFRYSSPLQKIFLKAAAELKVVRRLVIST